MNDSKSLSQMRKGALELVVLTVLTRGEAYGGALVDTLAHTTHFTITQGTVYPLLTRLRHAGLVNCRWAESPSGPPRKYYSLTASGIKHQQQLAEQFLAFAEEVTGLITG
ncbi:PadR family transcriptional regulator [Corynebacterium mendelii]|uniref:PadR family transcriptional regulator n=1 Tax=Corynebacterium mendelii TaxID=2765362 RepID=A0A939E0T5_9CORY|nr:PadR family transcriptional regulator [Corynebacterium mendelii]MBN9643636.1 PadR family transcriptional regulator [Corynebacterium mendelii]